MIEFYYKEGLLVSNEKMPYFSKDEKYGYVSNGLKYYEIIDWLNKTKVEYKDNASQFLPMEKIKAQIDLRDYQKRSLNAWIGNLYKGVLVLPTAAGKTYIGVSAIKEIQSSAIVVVPTIDLLHQWHEVIYRLIGIDAGEYGGGKKILKPVTIATYESALIYKDELGNKFKLLIVDEVHHLPSENFRKIAESFISPYRMGLTATYERPDMLHEILEHLMGGKIIEINFDELKENISNFEIRKIYVDLNNDEIKKYEEMREIFVKYLKHYHMRISTPWDFSSFIQRSWNIEGRNALKAWRMARDIAFNPLAKIEVVKDIIAKQRGMKTIIFTETNDMAYAVSSSLLVPCITYQTSKEERKEILKNFKESKYRILVSSKVLDEGVDVPDASIGIILSGSGSTRQFRQRLGRILRPGNGKKAILYEVVSSKTVEEGTSRRRKKGVATKPNTVA
jgi:superfamily II DNA or RNA helicase